MTQQDRPPPPTFGPNCVRDPFLHLAYAKYAKRDTDRFGDRRDLFRILNHTCSRKLTPRDDEKETRFGLRCTCLFVIENVITMIMLTNRHMTGNDGIITQLSNNLYNNLYNLMISNVWNKALYMMFSNISNCTN